jgi:hypothetical protein
MFPHELPKHMVTTKCCIFFSVPSITEDWERRFVNKVDVVCTALRTTAHTPRPELCKNKQQQIFRYGRHAVPGQYGRLSPVLTGQHLI